MTPTTAALRAPSIPDVVAPLFLGVNLAVYLAYVVGFFVAPSALASHFDITLGSTSALADFRAMYAGLPLGVAAIFVLGMRDVAYRAPAVMLATLTAGGLAMGRIITMVVDGMPGPIVLTILATEVGAAAVGFFLIKSAK